ncbi:MAG: single-stranded-DNA-specific exonuclease RecJ [Bacteroidetes bacterium]|nr:MAG: single-stranded-DNA-specific exonuclease RecJ [Bacteroidota bacterium]
MEKRWIFEENGDKELIEKLSKSLNINEILAKLLVQRGISSFDEAKDFFRPSLDKLHNPFLMLNMDKAVYRLNQAIENKEKILIYGDYDVDGTTSVTLVYSFLKEFYPNIDYYIPDRYKEGYGISKQGIDYAYKHTQSLIIALDCGIKANEQVEYAKEKDIDFIICDHHLPSDEVPKAYAVLDPKQENCKYPYKELSGCGVGFKFMQAYANFNKIPFDRLTPYLDLLAISIAADIVEIKGENRILAYYGLKTLNENPRPGIECILEYSNIKRTKSKNTGKLVFDKELSISDLVFTIAPRINAAGRMDSGSKSVELLNCKKLEKAKEMASGINKHNTERRTMDVDITEHALEIIKESDFLQKSKSTVVYYKDWHKGVLGIVASRISEVHYKPTIVLSLIDGMYTGSARSVKGFDIYEAIASCSDILDSFGGHKFAAGLSIKEENIKEFVHRFEKFVSDNITEKSMMPEIKIDSILNIEQINQKFYNVLKQFSPFGPGNMAPVFASDGIMDTGYAKTVGKNHLKLQICYPENRSISFNAIAFGQAEKMKILSSKLPFEICYAINENIWREHSSLQLVVKDIRTNQHS